MGCLRQFQELLLAMPGAVEAEHIQHRHRVVLAEQEAVAQDQPDLVSMPPQGPLTLAVVVEVEETMVVPEARVL
jgi:hypothetical protein